MHANRQCIINLYIYIIFLCFFKAYILNRIGNYQIILPNILQHDLHHIILGDQQGQHQVQAQHQQEIPIIQQNLRHRQPNTRRRYNLRPRKR